MKETDLNTVRFTFHVTDDGENADLTGASVRLAIKKPSGMTLIQDCTPLNAIEGVCEVILPNQAYLEVGSHAGELIITKGDLISVTRSFEYSSISAIFDDDIIESQNDWQILHELMLQNGVRPILGDGNPNTVVVPEYEGQTYLDRLNSIMYFASTLANTSWLPFGTGSGGGGGEVGPMGPQGPEGPEGPMGPQGIQGEKGEKGLDGTGVTILGSYSSEIDLNNAHPTGNVTGDAYIVNGDLYVWNGTVFENVGRIQGPEGPQGIQGLTGDTGPKGDTGLQGLTGDTGPQGPQGIKGDTGLTGDTGPQGPQGIQGIQGEIGPQGPQGTSAPYWIGTQAQYDLLTPDANTLYFITG